MPSRWAAASALIVRGRSASASKAATPRRSRSSATRTVVQVKPSGVLQRIRFMVTASSRSGHWPPSLRMTSTALGLRSSG